MARAFAAGLDAAEGRLWLREPIEDDPPGPRYRTQALWLERGARLLGLSGALSERAAKQIAHQLALMGLEHHALREQFGLCSRLEQRGKLLSELLSMLPLDCTLWVRLLAAGQLCGPWAPRSCGSRSSGKASVPFRGSFGRCVALRSQRIGSFPGRGAGA